MEIRAHRDDDFAAFNFMLLKERDQSDGLCDYCVAVVVQVRVNEGIMGTLYPFHHCDA